jgi:hypothetical protein
MAASRRWHCIHCGQTFISSDTDTCLLCRKPGGLLDPMDQAAIPRKRAESAKPEAAALPELQITPHGVLSAWRLLQMMIGGTVVTGAGIGMILIDAWLYGIFLICVGIAVFGFGIWVTLKAR